MELKRKLKTWTPLMALTVFAYVGTESTPYWVRMWAMAFALYFGFKWAVFSAYSYNRKGSGSRDFIRFFFLWPGMEIETFLDARGRARPVKWTEWLAATFKTTSGVILVWVLAPHIEQPFFYAWVGMIGLVLVLHFGSFHLLSLIWRICGVDAEPIMKAPLLSRNLSEFWSERWNRAFNCLANNYYFKPNVRTIGIHGALVFTFLISGLIHELVISVPARAGYGLPTLFFLFQGLGIAAERNRWIRRKGFLTGWRGRLLTWLILVAPLPALFHHAFLTKVIEPFLNVITS